MKPMSNFPKEYETIPVPYQMESKDEMLGSLQSKAMQFIVCCESVNVDTSSLVMDDLFNYDLNLDQSLRNYALKWLDDCIPTKPKKAIVKGVEVEIPGQFEKAFQIDKSEKQLFLQTLSLIASSKDSEGVKEMRAKLSEVNTRKFVKCINILFEKLYRCYDEEETKKAKLFLIHSMVNTKRLLLDKSDEYQQIFGLWSSDKGTGKDVFFKSMIYALTRKSVTSRNMSDLVRNFNYELGKTQGYFYLEELTEVDRKLKNQIKQIITADSIPIELKGKEVVNKKRKFTLCISANEEPSRMFSDENRERRAGFARIVGTNYFYKSKFTDSSMYLLWRFFRLMWIYCPIEYFYNTSIIKGWAETDSKRNITSNFELVERLREIASRNKEDVQNPQEKDRITIAQRIVKGSRFSRRDLNTVFDKERGIAQYEPNRFLKSTFVYEMKGSYFKLDYRKAIETEESLKTEIEETTFKTPSVTLDVDELCKCIEEDREFVFPEPKFENVCNTYECRNGEKYNILEMIGGDEKNIQSPSPNRDFKEQFLKGVSMSQYDEDCLKKLQKIEWV